MSIVLATLTENSSLSPSEDDIHHLEDAMQGSHSDEPTIKAFKQAR